MASIRDFKATVDGDWAIENGDFTTISGADAVPQGIRIRVGMFEGECYLDESIGVPYIDQILIKSPDPLVVRAVISAAIESTPDVTEVIGAQLLKEEGTRNASIAYTVDTVYSEQPFTDSVAIP